MIERARALLCLTALAFVAQAGLAALPAQAVTPSEPVAALDNLPPDPVTEVAVTPGAEGVEVTWSLSPSDGLRPAATGDVTSGGTFVSVNDVATYNIYRSENGGEFVLAGSVGPGESLLLDTEAISGATLVYQVTAADASGNESIGADSGPVSLGPPPSLEINRSNVDFGEVDAADSVSHVVVISNLATEDNANLSLSASIEFAELGVSFSGFSVEPATLVLGPGESGELTVSFSAVAAGGFDGDYAASLVLRTNDPDLADRDVTIGFTATVFGGTATPEIDLSAAAISFGQRKIGTTATRDVTISNLGGLPLIGEATATGSPAFTVTNGSFSIAPSGTHVVTVTFAPTAASSYTGGLTISSNDLNEGEVELAVTGTGVTQVSGPGTQVRQIVKGTLRVGDTVDPNDSVAVNAFLVELRGILAALLGISPDRIRINGISQGSTIVDFQITSAPDGSSEPTAAAAMTALTEAVADGDTDEFADLGGTQSFVDETEEVVLQALGLDGDPILGWFTFGAADSQVGFDDFFLFADNFGLTDVDAEFDPIYDIAPADAPNGAVDFDDFFRFADDFGKEVANADEIIAALP
jgi:hypothetical protein